MTESAPQAGSQKSFLRRNLRTIFLLILLCLVGWMTYGVYRSQETKLQRQQLADVGIVLTPVDAVPGSILNWLVETMPGLANSLPLSYMADVPSNKAAEILSENQMGDIVMVYSSSLGDEGLKYVSEIDEVQMLSLFNAPVTDQGLTHLEQMPNLMMVNVGQTAVTTAGIKTLIQKNKNLMMIHADPEKMTDEVKQLLQKNIREDQQN